MADFVLKNGTIIQVSTLKYHIFMSKLKIYNQVFTKILGIKETKLKKLNYQGVKAWDSVGNMNLIAVLEKKFDIEMDIDDIVDFSSYEKGKRILGRTLFFFDNFQFT